MNTRTLFTRVPLAAALGASLALAACSGEVDDGAGDEESYDGSESEESDDD